MRETKFATKNVMEIEHLENLDVEYVIILKYILNVQDGIMDLILLPQDKDDEGRNDPSASIKCAKFFNLYLPALKSQCSC
jgi:hypothetical protein